MLSSFLFCTTDAEDHKARSRAAAVILCRIFKITASKKTFSLLATCRSFHFVHYSVDAQRAAGLSLRIVLECCQELPHYGLRRNKHPHRVRVKIANIHRRVRAIFPTSSPHMTRMFGLSVCARALPQPSTDKITITKKNRVFISE